MKKRWFTLIEMLIVIVIIGILAWALIPRIGTARDKANDTAREANVRSLATALVSYGLDHGNYPENLPDLQNYSIPANNFAGQPTQRDAYSYRQLDNWAHFVITALLSDWSDAWNCTLNTAIWAKAEEKCTQTDVDTAWDGDPCKGGTAWTTVKTPAVAGTTWLAADLDTYNEVNQSLGQNWNGFCYLQ